MNDLAPVLLRHKLDVAAFFRMAEAGIIGERDRIELIDGELIDMAPIGTDHTGTVNWLTQALVLACRGEAIVSVQNPIHLDDTNFPQPDFALFRPRADYYRPGPHPGPADILLVVEVADTSLRFDDAVKRPLYARFGLPEYWIVDLRSRSVVVHRQPAGDAYREVRTAGVADRITLAGAPGLVIDLAALFG